MALQRQLYFKITMSIRGLESTFQLNAFRSYFARSKTCKFETVIIKENDANVLSSHGVPDPSVHRLNWQKILASLADSYHGDRPAPTL
jgi:hypothetical protein